jgi:pimeloyl-ACP methyl ester carboxylesterase
MNPNFYEDPAAKKQRRRREFKPFHWAGSLLWRVVRGFFRLLTYHPFSHIPGFRVEEGTPTSRFVRGLFYRLAFVPVMAVAVACAVVWTATHPRSVAGEVNPAWHGVYYEPVTFLGADQVPLEAWIVPVLDARNVIEHKEKVLRQNSPAVVLVHDIGQRREQMLPLIKPLHDAGFVVLALNLRGGGAHAVTGETFGLHEAGDVKAAVEVLRKRQFVDSSRIAVAGCGTGASAALLAAQTDGQIAAVVADAPIKDAHDLVRNRIMPDNIWLSWLSPLCKWTFEISYGVDAEDLELTNFVRVFDTRPVLLVDATGSHADPSDARIIEQVKSFLVASLPEKGAAKPAPVADAKH